MGILLFIIFIMFGPPIIFLVLGLKVKDKDKKQAKIFYIISVVYLIIGLGVCANALNNFSIH